MSSDDEVSFGDESNNDEETTSPANESSPDNESLSALQENISRKGKNSYYYAHGQKINGPEWDGREEPRKLSSVAVESSGSAKAVSGPVVVPIGDYAWGDEKTTVKIYIEHDQLTPEVSDEDIQLVS